MTTIEEAMGATRPASPTLRSLAAELGAATPVSLRQTLHAFDVLHACDVTFRSYCVPKFFDDTRR